MGSYEWGYRVTIAITHIRGWGCITLLITTHEPPSKGLVGLEGRSFLAYCMVERPFLGGQVPLRSLRYGEGSWNRF